MHILFLTTTNLTTNPRLLKEIKVALTAQFQVTVITFKLGKWTTDIEDELIDKLKGVAIIQINATRENTFSWLVATSINELCKKIFAIGYKSLRICAFSSDKRSFLLSNKLKGLSLKYDLVVAHNLGALYPAYSFSSKFSIPLIFDVEDYHPGESIYQDAKVERKRREALMKSILPRVAIVTAASPLIAEETKKLTGGDVSVVNNSFFSTEFIEPLTYKGEKVRFVWFSQNINKGRGLELILSALDHYKEHIQLTLIGYANQDFVNEWLLCREYINVTNPIPQLLLHQKLSEFDIGLALELSDADLNKDIALSNKIFAYKQAGLYILATDTKAQSKFINSDKTAGKVIKQNLESVIKGVDFVLKNISEIRCNKLTRFEKAKDVAFEHEASRLKNIWRIVANQS